MDREELKNSIKQAQGDVAARKRAIQDIEWEIKEIHSSVVKCLVNERLYDYLLPHWSRINDL